MRQNPQNAPKMNKKRHLWINFPCNNKLSFPFHTIKINLSIEFECKIESLCIIDIQQETGFFIQNTSKPSKIFDF